MNVRSSLFARRRWGVVLFAALGFGGTASAEPITCSCTLAQTQVGAQVGQVRSVAGAVMASLPSGYGAAEPGTGLYAGTRVMVGPKSSASMSFGTACEIEASENSTVNIQPAESSICVSVLGGEGGTQLGSVASENAFPWQLTSASGGAVIPPTAVPFTLFMSMAAGATIMSTTSLMQDDGNPVSR